MSSFSRCKVMEIIDNKSIKLSLLSSNNVAEDEEKEPFMFTLSDENQYLIDLIEVGTILNISGERIILQPDYLIDISAIASCFTEVGPHALNYIYSLVFPSEPSAYNLLGNTVNLFFDDMVHGSSRTYQEALQKTFHDEALRYLCVDEDDLRKIYFNTIAQHYNNVTAVVDYTFQEQSPALYKENGLIEPSFICPALGISGRMDYLEFQGDEASIVELKSGKRDEFRRCSKASHLIQTLLYAEALHHNQGLPYDKIHLYLLYNKYPLLSNEQYISAKVDKALRIRNEIIGYLHQIVKGEGERLFTTRAVSSMYNSTGKLWELYTKPKLSQKVAVIEDAKPEKKKWFFSQLQFILKEEELSRLGQVGASFNDRTAANIWLNNYEQKCADGKIISPLSLDELVLNQDEEVTGVRYNIIQNNEYSSHDFRKGDAVMLYPIDSLDTKAYEKIIIRGNIASITDSELVVELRDNENRNHFHPLLASRFACEHDIINNGAALACRSIYRMLQGRELPKDYQLIVGPPGTGKTSVALRNIILDLYTNTNQNILLLSFTHRAVDEICKTLEAIIAEDDAFLTYCRLGSEYECGEKKYSKKLLASFVADCRKRGDLQKKIDETRIFVSTTSRLNVNHELLDIKNFDTIIVDESSQLLDYHYIELLTHAKKFILIGDHKQLPAVTLQDTQRSLFERLYLKNKETDKERIVWLSKQGRMHPDIAKFANEMFYDNMLEPIPLPHQMEDSTVTRRYSFIDVTADNTSYSSDLFSTMSYKCNPAEAKVVAQHVADIISEYKERGEEVDAKTIGIIVPYRNQIAAIRKELSVKKIEEAELINIDTVERYQGSQRDVIIFSATISSPFQLQQLSAPIMIDGQFVDRKLNVIITRARKQLYIVGNKSLLQKSEIYRTLIEKMSH